jgi:general secretion pathway protein B
MSYILDALRRADSERERERSAVPGLHTQAAPMGALDGDGEARPNPWKWPIVAAFVALLALVAWLWFGRVEAPEPLPVLAAAPAPAPPAPAPIPQAPPPAAAAAAPPAAASAAPPPAPAPARKPPAPAARKREPAAASPTAKAPEPEPKIPKLSELPEDVRREVPAITVGGSIYSKSAASRMLVINGQVFHEGDALATGLVLEQIRQKSAVLRFRTHRYEITY